MAGNVGGMIRGDDDGHPFAEKHVILLSVDAYQKVRRSLSPLREAIALAVATRLSPDGQSSQNYSAWSGLPGTDRYCMVDFCGNAMVSIPRGSTERAPRDLYAVELVYLPGWFLQSVMRTVVQQDPGVGFVPGVEPLFEGHDPFAMNADTVPARIDMPVADADAAFPAPFMVTLMERRWCQNASGFKPYSIHMTPSSWMRASQTKGWLTSIEKLVWSRPRISIVALTGVDMKPVRVGKAAAAIYRPLFRTTLNARFLKTYETTQSHQIAHLGFNRVRDPELVPQGWHKHPSDFGRAHPADFLPPPMEDASPLADAIEPFKLPQDIAEASTGPEPVEDDVILEDTYEPANLPPPSSDGEEDQEDDAGPELGPDMEPDDRPVMGPQEPPKANEGDGKILRDALTPSARLAGLYTERQERHLDFCLNLTTTTGELFGFYSKKGIDYAAGKNMNRLLSGIHKLSPGLAAAAERNAGSFLEGDLKNLISDVMILEPLMLEVSFADPTDGDCDFEISVELMQENGWFSDNIIQEGQVDPAEETRGEAGSDIDLDIDPGPDRDEDGVGGIAGQPDHAKPKSRPQLKNLPDSQPYYRVRIRHTGKLNIGLRQPMSNLLGRAMPGFIKLYVEEMKSREEFRALPYKKWRARKPKRRHRRSLGSSDIRTHKDSPGLFADTLNEFIDTASLVGGFTPAVVIFDVIDVLHFVVYLETALSNLIVNGDPTGYTATGQKVEGVLQPVMLMLAAAPLLSKGKIKAGFQIVGATGALGLLGFTAWDTAANEPTSQAITNELSKRFSGYNALDDRTGFVRWRGLF